MGISLIPFMALSVAGIKSGLVYQFLTYPFIESSLMGVIFEGLLIWFIGSELELKWGRKFYFQFLLVAILTSGPFYFIIGSIFPSLGAYPLLGITSFTYGLLMAYAIIYSERQLTFMLLFPMKAKYFCMLLAAIQLYMGLTSAWRELLL
jgi:membrane associated rhomboid family serine protease